MGENGDRMINFFSERNHYYPISQTEPQDVFIAGYPKSGNTWMQHITAALIFGIDPVHMPDKLAQELVPDEHVKFYYKRFAPFACFKTHGLPRPEMKRVIHLVRDGRDAMASYHAMKRALKSEVTLEEMIKEGKKLFPGKWAEHTRQWLANPYGAEIMILKYEDLLFHPMEQMNRICSFLNIERTDEEKERVIFGTSFDQMKSKELSSGWDNSRWKDYKDFVRKGKTGTYKKEIPEELLGYFEKESAEQLRYFGYI